MFEHHSQHQMHIGHGNSPYFADTLTCFSGHLGLFHQFFCFHEVTSFSTRHAFKLFQTKSPFDGSWSVLLCYLILSYCPFLFALMMPNWLTHLVSWVSIRKSWNLKRDCGMISSHQFQPPKLGHSAGGFEEFWVGPSTIWSSSTAEGATVILPRQDLGLQYLLMCPVLRRVRGNHHNSVGCRWFILFICLGSVAPSHFCGSKTHCFASNNKFGM